MFKNLHHVVAVSIAFLAVLSCSSDPSSVAQKLLNRKCMEDSKGYFKIASFEKTDAVMGESFGVKYYEIKYKIEVEAIKDGGYIYCCQNNQNQAIPGDFTITEVESQGHCRVYKTVKGRHYQFGSEHVPSGYPLTHEMTLVKHEKGWVMKLPYSDNYYPAN
jgi:hypothetical protein